MKNIITIMNIIKNIICNIIHNFDYSIHLIKSFDNLYTLEHLVKNEYLYLIQFETFDIL